MSNNISTRVGFCIGFKISLKKTIREVAEGAINIYNNALILKDFKLRN